MVARVLAAPDKPTPAQQTPRIAVTTAPASAVSTTCKSTLKKFKRVQSIYII